MANMNIRTPRFYTDNISFLMSRGIAQNGNFDVTATDAGATFMGTFTTGSEPELFDMNPLNKVTFDTSSDPDGHVLITLDLQGASRKSYVAILNHNLATSVGKIRISAGDIASDVAAVDGANVEIADLSTNGWTDLTVTDVVNADTRTVSSDERSIVIEPATDGSTIIKFNETSLRYWGIQFEGNTTNTGNATDGTWGLTDLFVGCILIGEVYEMPHSPDLSVKRSIIFDQVNVVESAGGKRFGNMTSHGRTVSSTTRSPFSLSAYPHSIYGGRLAYDMNFSYLASTDIMPDEWHTMSTYDAVVEDIWNKTNGSHIPFIFSIDKDSEGNHAESEHILARFKQNSIDMTQVANDFFNISMRIEEEF